MRRTCERVIEVHFESNDVDLCKMLFPKAHHSIILNDCFYSNFNNVDICHIIPWTVVHSEHDVEVSTVVFSDLSSHISSLFVLVWSESHRWAWADVSSRPVTHVLWVNHGSGPQCFLSSRANVHLPETLMLSFISDITLWRRNCVSQFFLRVIIDQSVRGISQSGDPGNTSMCLVYLSWLLLSLFVQLQHIWIPHHLVTQAHISPALTLNVCRHWFHALHSETLQQHHLHVPPHYHIQKYYHFHFILSTREHASN